MAEIIVSWKENRYSNLGKKEEASQDHSYTQPPDSLQTSPPSLAFGNMNESDGQVLEVETQYCYKPPSPPPPCSYQPLPPPTPSLYSPPTLPTPPSTSPPPSLPPLEYNRREGDEEEVFLEESESESESESKVTNQPLPSPLSGLEAKRGEKRSFRSNISPSPSPSPSSPPSPPLTPPSVGFENRNGAASLMIASPNLSFKKLKKPRFKGDALLWYNWKHRQRRIRDWEDMKGRICHRYMSPIA